MSDLAIETHHLRKEFNGRAAVEDLTLSVARGEVFGFLGPNGAGKTTSVKMLLSLISPTSGDARVLGHPPSETKARQKIGFLPEHFRFHDWLRGDEFLALHAALYHMPVQHARRRVAELLEMVGLTPHAAKKLQSYSKGMLQRIGLAQALLNDPELVILDEPTSGLDPVGRRLVRDVIRQLRQRGTTVFLNSHFLSEVEVTCDRVAFIKHGRVLQISSLQSLVQGQVRLQVRATGVTPEMIAGLGRWSSNVQQNGENLTLALGDETLLPVVNHYLVAQGARVYAFQPQQVSLEDLFIQIVGTDGGL